MIITSFQGRNLGIFIFCTHVCWLEHISFDCGVTRTALVVCWTMIGYFICDDNCCLSGLVSDNWEENSKDIQHFIVKHGRRYQEADDYCARTW